MNFLHMTHTKEQPAHTPRAQFKGPIPITIRDRDRDSGKTRPKWREGDVTLKNEVNKSNVPLVDGHTSRATL